MSHKILRKIAFQILDDEDRKGINPTTTWEAQISLI